MDPSFLDVAANDSIQQNDNCKMENLTQSYLELKKKICKTHEVIKQYNDKLKECERLKSDLDAATKQTRKVTCNYNSSLAKVIKLELQNTEYKKNIETLTAEVNDHKIKAAADHQHIQQLVCKIKDVESHHNDLIMQHDLKKSTLEMKVKELDQELKNVKKMYDMKIKKMERKPTTENNSIHKSNSSINNDSTINICNKPKMIDVGTVTILSKDEIIQKPQVTNKCIITDEFYSIKDDMYPIFCAKCEVRIEPTPLEKICKIMTESCPKLVEQIPSPPKKMLPPPILPSSSNTITERSESESLIALPETPPPCIPNQINHSEFISPNHLPPQASVESTRSNYSNFPPAPSFINPTYIGSTPVNSVSVVKSRTSQSTHCDEISMVAPSLSIISSLQKRVNALEKKLKKKLNERKVEQNSNCCQHSNPHYMYDINNSIQVNFMQLWQRITDLYDSKTKQQHIVNKRRNRTWNKCKLSRLKSTKRLQDARAGNTWKVETLTKKVEPSSVRKRPKKRKYRHSMLLNKPEVPIEISEDLEELDNDPDSNSFSDSFNDTADIAVDASINSQNEPCLETTSSACNNDLQMLTCPQSMDVDEPETVDAAKNSAECNKSVNGETDSGILSDSVESSKLVQLEADLDVCFVPKESKNLEDQSSESSVPCFTENSSSTIFETAEKPSTKNSKSTIFESVGKSSTANTNSTIFESVEKSSTKNSSSTITDSAEKISSENSNSKISKLAKRSSTGNLNSTTSELAEKTSTQNSSSKISKLAKKSSTGSLAEKTSTQNSNSTITDSAEKYSTENLNLTRSESAEKISYENPSPKISKLTKKSSTGNLNSTMSKLAEKTSTQDSSSTISELGEKTTTKNLNLMMSDLAEKSSTDYLSSMISEFTERSPAENLNSMMSELAEKSFTENSNLMMSESTGKSSTEKLNSTMSELTEKSPIENLNLMMSDLAEKCSTKNLNSTMFELAGRSPTKNLNLMESKFAEKSSIEDLNSMMSELTEKSSTKKSNSTMSELTEKSSTKNLNSTMSELAEKCSTNNLNTTMSELAERSPIRNLNLVISKLVEKSSTKKSNSTMSELTERSPIKNLNLMISKLVEKSSTKKSNSTMSDLTEKSSTKKSNSTMSDLTEKSSTKKSNVMISELAEKSSTEKSNVMMSELAEKSPAENSNLMMSELAEKSSTENSNLMISELTEKSSTEMITPDIVTEEVTELEMSRTTEETDDVEIIDSVSEIKTPTSRNVNPTRKRKINELQETKKCTRQQLLKKIRNLRKCSTIPNTRPSTSNHHEIGQNRNKSSHALQVEDQLEKEVEDVKEDDYIPKKKPRIAHVPKATVTEQNVSLNNCVQATVCADENLANKKENLETVANNLIDPNRSPIIKLTKLPLKNRINLYEQPITPTVVKESNQELKDKCNNSTNKPNLTPLSIARPDVAPVAETNNDNKVLTSDTECAPEYNSKVKDLFGDDSDSSEDFDSPQSPDDPSGVSVEVNRTDPKLTEECDFDSPQSPDDSFGKSVEVNKTDPKLTEECDFDSPQSPDDPFGKSVEVNKMDPKLTEECDFDSPQSPDNPFGKSVEVNKTDSKLTEEYGQLKRKNETNLSGSDKPVVSIHNIKNKVNSQAKCKKNDKFNEPSTVNVILTNNLQSQHCQDNNNQFRKSTNVKHKLTVPRKKVQNVVNNDESFNSNNLTSNNVQQSKVNEMTCTTERKLNSQLPIEILKEFNKNSTINRNYKKELEQLEKIRSEADKSVVKQLHRIIHSEWQDALHWDVIEKLKSTYTPRIIAKNIVDYLSVTQKVNKNLDNTYTPPAPLMTKVQQRIVALLADLEESFPIIQLVQGAIEYKLFKFNQQVQKSVVELLARVYIILAKIKKDRQKVRIFCCDALYCMGLSGILVLYTVFTCWPESFPKNETNNDLLPKCIAHLLLAQQAVNYPKLFALKNLVTLYYKYPSGTLSANILKELLTALQEKCHPDVEASIKLLAKKEGMEWTYKNIIKGALLPMIINEKLPDMYRAFGLLGDLMRVFPIEDKDNSVGEIVEQLCDLISSGEGTDEQQEGVISALLSLSRHKFDTVLSNVTNWTPTVPLHDRTVEQIRGMFNQRDPTFWRGYLKKYEISKTGKRSKT
nr:uncharacterized protein LOC116425084 [Nomia melanderi]